jgi:hypothetical protein
VSGREAGVPPSSERDHEDEEDLAEKLQEFVYGTITVLVVIGALDGENLGSPRSATIVVVGTAVATWLAHAFASIIGAHIRHRRQLRNHEIVTKFRHSWRIVTAAIPTTVLLLFAGAGVFGLRTAFVLATVVGVVQMLAVAVIAARRSKFSFVGVVAYAGCATAIGLIIVAIEIAVFH